MIKPRDKVINETSADLGRLLEENMLAVSTWQSQLTSILKMGESPEFRWWAGRSMYRAESLSKGVWFFRIMMDYAIIIADTIMFVMFVESFDAEGWTSSLKRQVLLETVGSFTSFRFQSWAFNARRGLIIQVFSCLGAGSIFCILVSLDSTRTSSVNLRVSEHLFTSRLVNFLKAMFWRRKPSKIASKHPAKHCTSKNNSFLVDARGRQNS